MSMNESADPKSTSPTPQKHRISGIRTGLLVAGSALLGGLAVVLWNRKALANLRQPVSDLTRSPKLPDEETE